MAENRSIKEMFSLVVIFGSTLKENSVLIELAWSFYCLLPH